MKPINSVNEQIATARRPAGHRAAAGDTAGQKKTGADQRRRTDAKEKLGERDNAAAARHPSLFVIIFRYRQVPRTGGIILAQAKDRWRKLTSR